jgi:hypothetical protein
MHMDAPPVSQGSRGLLAGIGRAINPMPLIVGQITHASDAASAVANGDITSAAKNLFQMTPAGIILPAQADQARKAVTDLQAGDYSSAAGHAGAAALPIVGPAAANAGERIASGDTAGGIGEAIPLLAPFLAKGVYGRLPESVKANVDRAVAQARTKATPYVAKSAPFVGAAIGAKAGPLLGLPPGEGLLGGAYLGRQAGRMVQSRLSPKVPAEAPILARVASSPAASRPASPPEAPTSPTAEAAQPPDATPPARSGQAAAMSPQRIRNEVGLAAHRLGLTLTDDELTAADAIVAQGYSPVDAVQGLQAIKVQAAPVVAAPPKLSMTAAETTAYSRLRAQGLSHEAAVASIEQQRQLASALGTPSNETVRQRVAERNATGRWGRNVD